MIVRWTPGLQETVVQYIRAGGFEWVAAEAAGLPRPLFEQWLRRGRESRRQPYRGFCEAIRQARAQARLKAEIETRSAFPRDWLRHGPGRERPGRPGWSSPAKASAASGGVRAGLDPLLLGRLGARLLGVLECEPELRMRVAEVCDEFQKECRPEWMEDL